MPRGIVATDTDVWVTNSLEGTVSHIDVATERVDKTIDTGGKPGGVVLTADAVWVTDSDQDRVIKIDRATNDVVQGGEVEVGTDPGGMASTEDTVYVSNSGDDTVYAIDAATGEITARFETGSKPGGLAVTDTDLWVANTEDNTVSAHPAQLSGGRLTALDSVSMIAAGLRFSVKRTASSPVDGSGPGRRILAPSAATSRSCSVMRCCAAVGAAAARKVASFQASARARAMLKWMTARSTVPVTSSTNRYRGEMALR